MLNVVPLSQRNPKWSRQYLGFSKLTIGGYGCTITALTMLLNAIGYNETPSTVNAKLKSVNAFTGALLIWSRVELAYPKLNFVKRGFNYSNLDVSNYVYIKGIPVMVEVNAVSIGAPRHWVLFAGDRKMADPWTGKIESTSKYPLTGYTLFNK